MGKSIYYILVAITILLSFVFAKNKEGRKAYIIITAILHALVSGCRYKYLTGDLIKYNTLFYDYQYFGWFSDQVFQEGRNFGFNWLLKAVCHITGENFQLFLFIVAVIIEVIVAILIYKYSPMPWLSFAMWNCLGFYVFGFSAVKQSLSMAILMLSYICIIEKKPKSFVTWTLLASAIHLPALAFLPAYPISKLRLDFKTIIGYVVSAITIFALREPIVTALQDAYYEDKEFAADTFIGARFLMMILMLVVGALLKGFQGRHFSSLFMLIGVAAIFQMFCGYDNVFTRLADYYFQFVILYIPMLFADFEKVSYPFRMGPKIVFDQSMTKLLIVFLVAFGIWFYDNNVIVDGIIAVDDFTNYRFFWEVAPTPQ